MMQEALPAWPDSAEEVPDLVVPHATLLRLGRGDAAAGRRLLRVLLEIETEPRQIDGPTSKPSSVRLATIADEQSLVELLGMDVLESGATVAPISVPELWKFVQESTRDLGNRGASKPVIGVIGAEKGIEGAIFLEPEKWFWSDRWFLAERLTCVRPGHRRTRHAADLLQFAKWFADAMTDAAGFRVYLLANVVGTRDVERKVALFGRTMARAGAIYLYPSAPEA